MKVLSLKWYSMFSRTEVALSKLKAFVAHTSSPCMPLLRDHFFVSSNPVEASLERKLRSKDKIFKHQNACKSGIVIFPKQYLCTCSILRFNQLLAAWGTYIIRVIDDYINRTLTELLLLPVFISICTYKLT